MSKLSYLAAAMLFPAGLLFVFASVVGPALWVMLAVATGAGTVYVVALIDDLDGARSGPLRAVLVSAGSVACSAFLALLSGTGGALLGATGVAAAAAAAWLVSELQGRTARTPCFICKKVSPGHMFTCPRCRLGICPQPACWIARHFRCRSCDEREVPLFTGPEAWWSARVGPRVGDGECSSCYGDANEKDLRECGQCHWPMCRRCWDSHNGRCTHCQWVMPELPPDLEVFVRAQRLSGRR